MGSLAERFTCAAPAGKRFSWSRSPNCSPGLSRTATTRLTIRYLLDCGHEFTEVKPLEDGCIECPACELKWLEIGEVAGMPSLEDLLPQMPE